MELRSDIEFTNESWGEINEKLKGTFFETLWDAFMLCVSIGILYDSGVADKNEKDEKVMASIPRTMYNRHSEDMSYFFKTAILTTNRVSFSEKDRLFLAFSEDVNVEELEGNDEEILKNEVTDEAINFNKIAFLKEFANFGAMKIVKCITPNNSETMENIMTFLDDSYNCRTDELLEMKKIEELTDDLDDISG